MTAKTTPLTLKKVKEIAKTYPTPFVIYDEKAILDNFKEFKEAFSWVDWFQNYFAVKACPNPTIINALKALWSWADCSSMWELVMSELIWITWKNVMFTSNNTKYDEFMKAHKIWAIINFDDITHIDYYKEHIGFYPRIACCRYNPGPLKKWNTIIGKPEEAKYGMKKEQLLKAYEKLQKWWTKHFWLHTMVASNELDPAYFVETAKILFELVVEIEEKLGITFDFVNLWGWIGIPYKPEQKKVDLKLVSKWIKNEYDKIIWNKREKPLKIVMECWRMITGPYGYLVTEVLHVTDKYKQYVWVDASMQCLMRPALYWAYHHITVLWKEDEKLSKTYDVTWSLCENNDKFAIDRKLPEIDEWDYIVIHDAWAHWTAMWFNYNAKLRPAELLLDEKWKVTQIRRAETLHELFSTINWINWFEYTA